MSAPRRRRPNEEEMNQSLLGPGEPRSSSSAPTSSRQMIVHRPFCLEAFIQAVVQSWLALIRSLRSCVQALVAGGSKTSLSLIQAERLEELRERLQVPYDASNSLHQLLLQELWEVAFPGMHCTSLHRNAQWKEMGWQGEDPVSDFRGAGLLGLENLVYLGTRHPQLFQQLQHKTQGSRVQWEYPFAAAGINLTFELTQLLGVGQAAQQQGSELPTTAPGVAFCELLHESDAAFEEVYCAAFALLDRVWLQQKATYMEFNQVMKAVKTQLSDALNSRPKSLQQLQLKLSGGSRQ